jgi:hypothetical protein
VMMEIFEILVRLVVASHGHVQSASPFPNLINHISEKHSFNTAWPVGRASKFG